ncbi:T9SS type A sorting domain-containing protein [Chryseobacterium terrae]|uniref:T9SS type A sorting domain-containing protein n=1 Tax=Chryseobacterium terrae TaxID=3163299 RepID=A0ABW8Y1N7_9FLAO
MKKTLFFLLSLTMFGTAFSQVILNDNFNSYNIANLGTQGGWARDGATAAEAKIAEIDAANYGKSLRFPRTTTEDMWVFRDVANAWTNRTSGNNILEVKYNFYSGSGLGFTSFQLYADGSDFFNIAVIRYSHDTKELDYYNENSTAVNPLMTLTDNTWYNISLSYNYTDGQTKISVNGTAYGPFTSTANKNITEIDIYTGENTLTSGIDNIDINAVSSVTLGTTEAIVKSDLNVYPNPVSDIVNVTSDKKISNVTITDLSGKTILKSKDSKLNIKNFANGIYLLTVNYADGITETKKIIKK